MFNKAGEFKLTGGGKVVWVAPTANDVARGHVGRRSPRWGRKRRLRTAPTIESFLSGGQEQTRSFAEVAYWWTLARPGQTVRVIADDASRGRLTSLLLAFDHAPLAEIRKPVAGGRREWSEWQRVIRAVGECDLSALLREFPDTQTGDFRKIGFREWCKRFCGSLGVSAVLVILILYLVAVFSLPGGYFGNESPRGEHEGDLMMVVLRFASWVDATADDVEVIQILMGLAATSLAMGIVVAVNRKPHHASRVDVWHQEMAINLHMVVSVTAWFCAFVSGCSVAASGSLEFDELAKIVMACMVASLAAGFQSLQLQVPTVLLDRRDRVMEAVEQDSNDFAVARSQPRCWSRRIVCGRWWSVGLVAVSVSWVLVAAMRFVLEPAFPYWGLVVPLGVMGLLGILCAGMSIIAFDDRAARKGWSVERMGAYLMAFCFGFFFYAGAVSFLLCLWPGFFNEEEIVGFVSWSDVSFVFCAVFVGALVILLVWNSYRARAQGLYVFPGRMCRDLAKRLRIGLQRIAEIDRTLTSEQGALHAG